MNLKCTVPHSFACFWRMSGRRRSLKASSGYAGGIIGIAPQRACLEALHAGSSTWPAPRAQRLLAPRFSVGWALPSIHPESRKDDAHSKHRRAMPEALLGLPPQRARLEALHAGSSTWPAPRAQRLLAPRFSVGWALPSIHPESRRDGAHRLDGVQCWREPGALEKCTSMDTGLLNFPTIWPISFRETAHPSW